MSDLPPPSDLRVDAIQFQPAGGFAGDQFNISFTVSNQSIQEAASGRWSDSAYLSQDGTWDLGDVLLTSVSGSQSLAPGQSYTRSNIAVRVPVALANRYRVIVRTDIFDDINEGENNRNNIAASGESFEVRVKELVPGVAALDQLGTDQNGA